MSGFIAYATDMSIVQEVVDIVLKATNCPSEDPAWGDGGVREARIERAIKVLAWAHRWVNYRNGNEWSSVSLVREVLEPITGAEAP